MIVKTTEKTKCDARDCKNMACCFVAAKGLRGKFFLCQQCLQAIAQDAAPSKPPKSPKNLIKKVMDRQAEEAYERQ